MVVAALVVTGCTPFGGTASPDGSTSEDVSSSDGSAADGSSVDGSRPAAQWQELPAPDSPTDGRLATDVTIALAPGETSAALLVGSMTTRPAPPTATVWVLGRTGWEPTALPDGENLTVTAAAEDGGRTWLAGWRWDTDTGVSAALLSSTDRTRWREEPTAGAPDGAYPGALVPTDDGLVVLGRTVDEVPFAWRPDDAAWVPLPLPEGHDGRLLDAVGPVGDPGAVVAVVGSSEPGAPELPSSVVSEDAGCTWSPGEALPGDTAGVSGVAVDDDTLVATGWQRQDGRLVPASWLSPDGRTWTAEDPTGQAGLDLSVVPGEDVWLGAPTVGPDGLVAALTVRSALDAFLLDRVDDGWTDPGCDSIPAWESPGLVPLVEAVGDDLLVVQSVSGGVRVRLGVDDDWQEWRLGDALAMPEVTHLVPAGDDAVLWTRSARVDLAPTGAWTRGYQAGRHAITPGGTVDALAWPGGPDTPDVTDVADRLSAVVPVPREDGSSLVLGQSLTEVEGDTDLVGWWDRPDGSRQLVEGLSGPASEWVRAAAQVDGDWYAVGGREEDISPSSPATGQTWRSDDGLTWTPLPGDYRADDESDSVVQDVCGGPDGQVLAVGTADVDGTSRAVVWRLDDEQGATRLWTSDGEQPADLTGCVDAGDAGLLLTGEAAGAPTVWTTTDGATFAAEPLGALGSTFGRVRAVDGGFAAAGQTTEGDGAWTGGVVHLSPDGLTWRTLRLPADVRVDGVDVLAVGEDLLVAGDTDGGPRLWRLLDYAAQL